MLRLLKDVFGALLPFALLSTLIGGIPVFLWVAGYYEVHDISVTIDSKERITTGSGESMSSKYLVYSDQEVFENTDSFWFFKFNSSDVYVDIKEGQRCDLKVFGWRVTYMSMYRNILEANCHEN